MEKAYSVFKCAEERSLFFLYHLHNEFLLCGEFRESGTHFLHECRYELVDEGLLLAEERVAVAYGTTQNAADDIACFCVGRQLSVGNGEGNGAQVVNNDAQCDVFLFVITVFAACHVGHNLD